jgi:hypothetical protein
MLQATFSRALDPRWALLPPLRLGPVGGTAYQYVLVEADGRPWLRLDLHARPGEGPAFEDALVWGGSLVVGWGHHVHLVRLADRAVSSLDLGGHFGHLYPAGGCLLVTSAERLFRVEPGGALAWVSRPVGLDGVVVVRVRGGVVEGKGEWDPPGGWRPFRLRLDSGEPC